MDQSLPCLQMVLEKINGEIKEAPFFGVMVDETTDSETKNQMTTIIRYVHEGELRERFMGFKNVSELSGNRLS